MRKHMIILIFFTISVVGLLYILSFKNQHISDSDRSISNIKILVLCVKENNPKYDLLYDYYRQGLTGFLIFVSPFTPPQEQEKIGKLKNLVMIEQKLLTEKQFDVICGYKYQTNKKDGTYCIFDKYKPELKISGELRTATDVDPKNGHLVPGIE